jgi:phosphate ABC transporter phosphate-binding protein
MAVAATCLIVAAFTGIWGRSPKAAADTYVPVSGAGSTWSANAIDQWISDVVQYGMRVNYAPNGSSDGRKRFLDGTVDYAGSDIPFQSHPEDGSLPEVPAAGSYAYMPITAGGTAFMYNLTINGQRVTNLRLSGAVVAKIFTGQITTWTDPAIAADNPGLRLPSRKIVPVVRSDGSGSTYQFTLWMISQYPDVWNAFCSRVGRQGACGPTSYYPTVTGMVAQNGDLGVAGYVAQNYAEGAIGYVNYSYALNAHFPVAKLLNKAGYYTEPTAQNVAVSLLKAVIDTSDSDPSLYLTQKLDGVYSDSDPRTYEQSFYSYLILPTKLGGQFSTAKGKTLGAFAYYAMCQGQQESASLGYSPMPVNLVQASFDQIRKIPGVVVENIDITKCNNPTFSPTSPNLLADTAPMPPACDKQGPTQCTTGTGGLKTPTKVTGGAAGSTGGGATSTTARATGVTGGTAGGSSRGGASPAAGLSASGGGSGAQSGGTGNGSAAAGAPGGASGGGSGAAQPACDPSSGSCGDSNGTSSDGGAGSADQAAANPVTIAAHKGWTDTQTLMALVFVLLVALVVTPGLLARYLDRYRK